MVSMSDELKERNILKLILIVRFACATLDVGHPTHGGESAQKGPILIEIWLILGNERELCKKGSIKAVERIMTAIRAKR
jgi:hypothetical protein